jgi:hypothetical protein
MDAGADTDNNPDTEACETSIVECEDDDNCCPSTCTASNDNDCYTHFLYDPSNFDPDYLGPGSTPQAILLDCDAIFDSGGTPSFEEWCGQPEPSIVVDELSDPEVVILTFTNFGITDVGSLKLVGERPVILAVFGDGTINGIIDVSADENTPGAGGNHSCGSSAGDNGVGSYVSGSSGGGGGGYGTSGGMGGNQTAWKFSGGSGGDTRGSETLIPLLGGCPGGRGGGCYTKSAAGGGAIQISAAGTLTITGEIQANGGDGLPGCLSKGGGNGGGSGGGILLEGNIVDTTDGDLSVKGGDGGNGRAGGLGGDGANSSDLEGGAGEPEFTTGAGGGGGGYDRILINMYL